MTDFYTQTQTPGTSAQLSSAAIRAEFALIEAAFAKVGGYTGNDSMPLFVNAAGTAQEAISAATARTRLGIAIGSDVQAYDATLASLALLGTAADKFAYTTDVDTWAEAAITAAGRALLDDASADAQLSTLGVTAYAKTLLAAPDAAAVRSTIGVGSNGILLKVNGTENAVQTILDLIPGANITITDNGDGTVTAAATGLEPADATILKSADIGSTVQAYDATILTESDIGAVTGYPNIPQNSKSADYTTVLGDASKHIYHPTTDDNPRTFTIDSNANVAYDVGSAITFVNDKNTVTIAITSDTLVWAQDASTGSRTLANGGVATALKVAATRWVISGAGLS